VFSATITVSSDDPDDPAKDIFLSGEGVVPPPPGTLFGSTAGEETLVIIDPQSGNATPVGSTAGPGGITEIEFREDGVLFGSTGGGSSNIVTINIFTGEPTLVGQHTFGAVNGLEFSPGGTLFGTYIPSPGAPSELVILDQSNGSLTFVGLTGFSNIGGLAFASDGTLYGITSGSIGGDLVMIDTLTGSATFVGSTGFTSVGSLEFSPEGTLYAGLGQNEPTNPGALITIDPTTGSGTLVGPSGFSTLSGLSFFPDIIESIDNEATTIIPEVFELFQNYPNPFNPTTNIRFALPNASEVKIEVFNILGQSVAAILDEKKPAGYHTIFFDARNLASGLYFYQIKTDNKREIKKMLLIK
jgi:hypothetical protein